MNYEYQNYLSRLYDKIKTEIGDNYSSDSSDTESSSSSNDEPIYYINNNPITRPPEPRHHRVINIDPNQDPDIETIYNRRNIYEDYGNNRNEMNIERIKKLLKFEENKFIIKLPEPPKICPVMQEEIREGYKTNCNHYFSYEGILNWIKESKKTCPVCRENLY